MNRLDADFSERFRAPPELVLFDVFRWFAFVFVAVFVISIGIRMSIGNAALFATLPAVFMAGWQAFAIWCFDEYELVRSAWSVAIARRESWKSPWTVLRVPANRCRLVPAPPDSGAAFLLLFPSLGGRLWFAAPCGRTPESRAFWESSVPAAVEPPPRYRHPALAAIAKTAAVLALALPLTVAHLALFSFAMVPERPIQPACAAMVLFCLYASAAQALFLWSVGRFCGAGCSRGFAVLFLVFQTYYLFIGATPALSSWSDPETGRDLRSSIVLVAWAVLWSFYLLFRVVRPHPATNAPAASKSHAETAEPVNPATP